MTTFERKIYWKPAYNRMAEGYGRHCVDMHWVLIGPKGAISWCVFTGWFLPQDRDVSWKPTGAGVSTHSRKKIKDEYRSEKCEYLGGKPCWGGTSFTGGDPIFEILIEKGEEAAWKELEDWYAHTFEKAEP